MIRTIELFPKLSNALLELLRGLGRDEWLLPTAISGRTVKDLASHLLDGTIRRLSFQRDGHRPPPPRRDIAQYADLVSHIQEINAEWILATRRISPLILIDLIAHTEPQLFECLSKAALFDTAPYPVSWVGDATSPNWLDIAREFTEKWHHQAQIRLATKRPPIEQPEFMVAVVRTFLLGLPFAFRHAAAPQGTVVTVSVTGAGGGDWHIQRDTSAWEPLGIDGTPINRPVDTTITIDSTNLWKLLSGTVSPDI